ncbi:MAG: aldo/keto reductase [Opitutaceae bacterium]
MIPSLPFGKANFRTSAICLGTMYFGTKIDEATAFSLLDFYAGAGGNFLDTANKYASWLPGGQGGESEMLLGRWMRQRGNRQEMMVATKLGLPMPGVEAGLRAAQIEQECEKSLQRLGTDVIDLYYSHADDRKTPLEETLTAMDRLVRSGKVRQLGASNYVSWRLLQSLYTSRTGGWAEYACVQLRHSYLRPNPWMPQEFAVQVPASREMIELCADQGLRLLAYSPLLGGAYTRTDRPLPAAYDTPDNQARLGVLRDVAKQTGFTPNQIVLAWLMQSHPAAIPLTAASTVEQLRENLGAADVHLAPDILLRLDNATCAK